MAEISGEQSRKPRFARADYRVPGCLNKLKKLIERIKSPDH
jgi:hypothetical protein